MEKVLRSLIHEVLPYELRVELEILSKRRDLDNPEKHQEMILLIRKYGGEPVQLGPGTNRYTFKMKGFVVKFATDSDGKIDNMKEFKMAKTLYPHVIMVHEISTNGTIMICEYIEAFTSYSEMLEYEDQILEILKDISSTYLIGDVGISENNYSNWGRRIGTKIPVCLDFAYVYEIKSSLFVCSYCDTGSMLVPDKNFRKLICSNPKCNRTYLFEDIRIALGDNIENHDIGDLAEEGYLMSSASEPKELDTYRSGYLLNQKSKKEKIHVEEKVVELPDFVMDLEPKFYL